MLSPPQGPGWVYVLTCPDFPGCVKIGGTSRTPTVRAAALVREYGTQNPFQVVRRIDAVDWFAVEQATHRMLDDRRLPRSELFRVSPRHAARVIRTIDRAYRKPWALTVWLRRCAMPATSRGRYGQPWRRRGTNWIPLLLVLSIAAAAVVAVRPVPPAWLPLPIAHTMELVERL